MSSRKNSVYRHSDSFILPPKKRILREFQRRELQNHHDDSSVIPAAKKKRIHNHHDSFPELKKKVEKMGGYDLKMVIEKKLFQRDLNPITNGRFSIPEKEIHKESKNFLKPHEIKWLERSTIDKKREGIMGLNLRRRELQNHHDDSSVIPAAKKKRIHNHHDPFPELKKKVEKMGGYDLKMVIEKKLFQRDLDPITNGRFSIPEKQIHKEAKNFLKPHEIKWLERSTTDKKREGMNVLVLDPKLREFNLVLKKWSSMTYGYTYNLTHHWNDIVDCNDFKLYDTVQLWSFRRFNNKLGFALVTGLMIPRPSPRLHSLLKGMATTCPSLRHALASLVRSTLCFDGFSFAPCLMFIFNLELKIDPMEHCYTKMPDFFLLGI
ncbi:hypothetical protein K1719_014891 [Acacia pycnantha]|nr:hypothetical protein K1719_014891 [Acacia pycnantha]